MASKQRMASDATIDCEEQPFTCPYCGKETVVESPMYTILVGLADCEHCGREFLIENDVSRTLPH
jgi:transcription elongation factor Elf1